MLILHYCLGTNNNGLIRSALRCHLDILANSLVFTILQCDSVCPCYDICMCIVIVYQAVQSVQILWGRTIKGLGGATVARLRVRSRAISAVIIGDSFAKIFAPSCGVPSRRTHQDHRAYPPSPLAPRKCDLEAARAAVINSLSAIVIGQSGVH